MQQSMVIIWCLLLMSIILYSQDEKKQTITNYRSTPERLNLKSVMDLIQENKFYDSNYNKTGAGLDNNYQVGKSGLVVIDYASRLTWLRSPSTSIVNWDNAHAYVLGLNQRHFGGYSDWRLPTLEEAMSLVEKEKRKGNLHIDPLFDIKRRYIWTADSASDSRPWVIDFINGGCDDGYADLDEAVLVVRSGTTDIDTMFKYVKQPMTTVYRSSPLNLTEKEVKQMIRDYGFYDRYDHRSGPGAENNYQVGKLELVVIDHASGLIWQQSGSENLLNWENAQVYILQLNQHRFGGFSDWRLPTLEEAMSLVEMEEVNGDLHIDSVFDSNQSEFWTSDSKNWVVEFSTGASYQSEPYSLSGHLIQPRSYVRAVRSDNEKNSEKTDEYNSIKPVKETDTLQANYNTSLRLNLVNQTELVINRELKNNLLLYWKPIHSYFPEINSYQITWIMQFIISAKRFGVETNGQVFVKNCLTEVTESGFEYFGLKKAFDKGEYPTFAFDNFSDVLNFIGVGTFIHFGSLDEEWVPFFDNKYRKGGVTITSDGFSFKEETEAIMDDTIWIFVNGSWMRKQTKIKEE